MTFDLLSLALELPTPADIVIVSLDERSHEKLSQPYDRTWDRRLHAVLIDQLRARGAKLVVFDMVFEQASADPEADGVLSAAMQRSGRVMIGASLLHAQEAEGRLAQVRAPLPAFRRSASGWGLISFNPLDLSDAIRRLPSEVAGIPPLAEKIAAVERGDSDPKSPGSTTAARWMRYHGPPGTFPQVSYFQAVGDTGFPEGFFNGKIVLVGASYATGFSGSAKDSFSTPYSRFRAPLMSGTEVLANEIGTLREKSYLRRPHRYFELLLLLTCAWATSSLYYSVSPRRAFLCALIVTLAGCLVAFVVAAQGGLWVNTFLVVGITSPVALVWSFGASYLRERARREAVMRAFGAYLSPEMARRAVEEQIDLSPGGKNRIVTAMMTDIGGYTSISEKMEPELVGTMLVEYFSELTKHVFDHQGTVVQFVEDATYCVWGAPFDVEQHAERALRAAWAIKQRIGTLAYAGRKFPTRIGLSTGHALCGNLGSRDRFDYAVVGDNTNVAARIERLNKALGTDLLVADSTRRLVTSAWRFRDIGDFAVSGREAKLRLWQPIAEPDGRVTGQFTDEFLHAFDVALAAWRRNELGGSLDAFRAAAALLATPDGPTTYYLRLLARNLPPREAELAE